MILKLIVQNYALVMIKNLVNTKVGGEQMKKELLVLKGLAMQWQAMLCVVLRG